VTLAPTAPAFDERSTEDRPSPSPEALVHRLLLVEDDPSVRETASLVLERAGFDVVCAGDGVTALELLEQRSFDLVVLDVMLPGMSGFEVCRQLRRETAIPIVMLTARSGAEDVVTGLELGADDYVTKPFEPNVLTARLRAVLRRTSHDPAGPLTARDLVVDEAASRAARGGADLHLTRIELRLLAELVRHAGEVMSRGVLLDRVWGYDYLGDSRLVDMAVKRLRDKLGEPPEPPPYIATVRSVGYRFERG
jgi:two-component system, OmpR family, response regulator MtrA